MVQIVQKKYIYIYNYLHAPQEYKTHVLGLYFTVSIKSLYFMNSKCIFINLQTANQSLSKSMPVRGLGSCTTPRKSN
jgi:hypothetical protein